MAILGTFGSSLGVGGLLLDSFGLERMVRGIFKGPEECERSYRGERSEGLFRSIHGWHRPISGPFEASLGVEGTFLDPLGPILVAEGAFHVLGWNPIFFYLLGPL